MTTFREIINFIIVVTFCLFFLIFYFTIFYLIVQKYNNVPNWYDLNNLLIAIDTEYKFLTLLLLISQLIHIITITIYSNYWNDDELFKILLILIISAILILISIPLNGIRSITNDFSCAFNC